MRPNILVVENHNDLRSEIVECLRRQHFECVGVSSGDEAMLKLRDGDYKYIVLDVDVSTAGRSVYESCAANGTLSKLVLLTDPDDGEMSIDCATLRKPFDSVDLLDRVTR